MTLTPGQATSARARLEIQQMSKVRPKLRSFLAAALRLSQGNPTLGEVLWHWERHVTPTLAKLGLDDEKAWVDIPAEVQLGLRSDNEISPAQIRAKAEKSLVMIVRTSSTRSYGNDTLDQLAQEGYRQKRWVSHHDNLVRPTHLAADGQTVPLSATFAVGTNQLMYPADPMGSAAEIINCRCVLVGV